MTAAEAEDEVKRRLLLEVVIAECAAVLELLSSEDEALLIGGNAFLVLNLGLDVVDCVGGFDVERDGLAGERFYEDLGEGVRLGGGLGGWGGATA